MMKRFQKPPFLCVHIDQMRFQKPPFLWISTFDSVFENLRSCGVFVRISVNTFTKTNVFLSVFVQKRSSVNGAHVYMPSVTLGLRRSNRPIILTTVRFHREASSMSYENVHCFSKGTKYIKNKSK